MTLSNQLILSHPHFLLPSIFPNNRFFSNELALCIRRPKYWSFSFSIRPSKEYSGLISFMLSHFSHIRLFATPSDCSPPGSSIHGILRAIILEWVAIPSPGIFPTQGSNPYLFLSPALACGFFTTSTTWEWFDLLAVLGTLKSLLQHHSSNASILQGSASLTVQLSDLCLIH